MRIKTMLLVSITLNLLLFSLVGMFGNGAMGFDRESYPPTYENRKSLLDVLPEESNNIVFVGDSITEFCEWSELFKNPRIKNRGIAGDRTSGVLERIDKISASRPSKIFLMIGINDLGRRINSRTIVSNYREIISTIRQKSPQTEIFVQSVLPINMTFRINFYRFTVTIPEIIAINNELKRLSVEFKATYINLFPLFTDGYDQLDAKYTFDGLHLNGRAYLVWKEAIEKYVD